MNLLSIHHIFHLGSGKIIDFSPHDVIIQELHDFEMIVATGSVDFAFCIYRFNRFESSNDIGSCLVAHADSITRLWHKHLGHVNYKYLH